MMQTSVTRVVEEELSTCILLYNEPISYACYDPTLLLTTPLLPLASSCLVDHFAHHACHSTLPIWSSRQS